MPAQFEGTNDPRVPFGRQADAAVSLDEYERKRDFTQTGEPRSRRRRPGSGAAIFVVQLHHARRRHYDFRLQVGNALRSWAVPKGPTTDPAIKRMAVEVEDHPLDYASFEGDIPAGQYGAGRVQIFDQGEWQTDGDPTAQLKKGHLRFTLYGQRLKGGWHLVRTGAAGLKARWLLFKDRDAHAGDVEADDWDLAETGDGEPKGPPAGRLRWREAASRLAHAVSAREAPAVFEPQLASVGRQGAADGKWLHEIKWDGYRMIAVIEAGQVSVFSRSGLDWTSKVPAVCAALGRIALGDALLDGELIAGEGKVEDFTALQAALSGERPAALNYVAFDLLRIDGVDVSRAPLVARKALLAAVLESAPAGVAFSGHVDGDARRAFELAVGEGFEGIISKRADAPHRPGRGRDWIKHKAVASEEYAVVGFTPPRGSRAGIGALLLATPDAEHGWRYAGRVGSGFSDAQLAGLARYFEGDGRDDPSVHLGRARTGLRDARWVTPTIVVEVHSRGISASGLLRQPSLKAIRTDKRAEQLLDGDAPDVSARAGARKQVPTGTEKPSARVRKPTIDVTNPDRVVYPGTGLTKGGVAEYYRSIEAWILPELCGRPLSALRCPGGITGECFFQKHPPSGMRHIGELAQGNGKDEPAPWMVVEDAAGLAELVQFGVLEFHPWGALASDPDHADRMVFDLDPGPGVVWEDVVGAARLVRDLLSGAGLESFVRTTGGKGLHVVAPLRPPCSWEAVSGFSAAFAKAMAAMDPSRFVATAALAKRQRRIFVDHLRNRRGATAVASFSLRARPGAPVSMPLRWTELGRMTSGAHFDLGRATARLARLKSHPWSGFDHMQQNLDGLESLLAERAAKPPSRP